MPKHIHTSLLLLFLLPNLALSASAQATYAVVVGISDYARLGPRSGDLNFADDDARLFVSLLQSRAGGSVPARNIILLTEQQATRNNILRAMGLFQRATQQDRIIFFFSGHGNQGILSPYDASPNVFLQHNDIKRAFRQSAAHTKLILADACKSGSMSRHTSPPAAQSADLNKNVVVMMSSRANQTSQELSRLQHGAFTYFLVRGASGEADADHNRIVTMQELYKYMRTTIQSVTGNQQIPVVFGKFPVTMPFTYIGS